VSESEFGGDKHDGDSGGGANVDDSEAIEEPIVRVIGGAECVPDDMANALQCQATMIQVAQEKSCSCKRIVFEDSEHGFDDRRRGCIRQFSPDEIVRHQLAVQEMERGMCINVL
jgi:hypothetical protein